MNSKRVYLFLTGGLLLLSIGIGFTIKHQHSPNHIAMQALQTASLQLHRSNPNAHQSRALELIQQAIQEMRTSGQPANSVEQAAG
jgi:hypothetical protein